MGKVDGPVPSRICQATIRWPLHSALCGSLIGHIFNSELGLAHSDNFFFRSLHLLRISVSSS